MKLSITSLTRNTKALSDAIVRGETITLTRHGKDFATVSPVKKAWTGEDYRIVKRHHKALVDKSKDLLYEP